ncbi:MAG: polysaccharide biosynthesis tyrosine autokinase [Candidatus Omnitrophica bacterium]|nr:polysaccharide biosynthesis tyrosine autokinase [Candidatus Omnitrophota bacterium]
MAEYALNLWDYWRIIYKRKWIIISVFLISVISSYLFVEKVDPLFRSSVTLFINTSRTPIAEITGSGVTFWGGGSENFETQLELIRSYKTLKRVALDLGYITEDSKEERVQDVVAGLRGKINVSIKETTELVIISATDKKPLEAKKIAETVANVFIENRWEKKVEQARNTKEFVEKQLKKIDETITDVSRKLEILGVEPTGLAEAPIAPKQFNELDQRARLIQLQLTVEDLRVRYTDNYPGIINRLLEIEALEKELNLSEEEKAMPNIDREVLNVSKLRNELVINQKLYGLLKERYEKALILEASKTKDTEIVDPASLPRASITAQATSNFVLAGAIGLILGFVAAFVVESMDTSIGTIEDVEDYLKMPVLGVIPQIDIDKKEEMDYWKEPPPPEERKKFEQIMGRMVIQYQPKSSVSEAYRNLQTYIKFSGLDKVGNCLMFTSAGIQEGKTITTINSALSMAQMGYKVLLVDADLRRPNVHRVFGIDRGGGLTEAVLGTLKLTDVIKTIDDIMLGNIKSSMIMKTYGMENLNIITSGHLPTNPTEVLGSQNMTDFIKEVKSKFQVIFFDSAPILPVTDSCILSSKVDGVILVYKSGYVSRGALKRAKVQIEGAKGNPIGVVLNSMRASDMKFGSPFYYYQQKYYGEDEGEK